MKQYFLPLLVVMALISPLVAAGQKPVFHGSWHRNQLLAVAVATVVAHPIACGVDAFRRPVGRDIQEKQTLAKSVKAAICALFIKKAWLSPYVNLVRSLLSDPTRDVTKSQAMGAFVKNHKLFTAVGSALLLDALVVAGTGGKHYLNLKKWEKDQPARQAEAARIKKEQDDIAAEKKKKEAAQHAVEAGEKAEKFNMSRIQKNYFKAWKDQGTERRLAKQQAAECRAQATLELEITFPARVQELTDRLSFYKFDEAVPLLTTEEELQAAAQVLDKVQAEQLRLQGKQAVAGVKSAAGIPARTSTVTPPVPKQRGGQSGVRGNLKKKSKDSSSGVKPIDDMSMDEFDAELLSAREAPSSKPRRERRSRSDAVHSASPSPVAPEIVASTSAPAAVARSLASRPGVSDEDLATGIAALWGNDDVADPVPPQPSVTAPQPLQPTAVASAPLAAPAEVSPVVVAQPRALPTVTFGVPDCPYSHAKCAEETLSVRWCDRESQVGEGSVNGRFLWFVKTGKKMFVLEKKPGLTKMMGVPRDTPDYARVITEIEALIAQQPS